MDNNKNGSNTDDILKIIEEYRKKNEEAPVNKEPAQPAPKKQEKKSEPKAQPKTAQKKEPPKASDEAPKTEEAKQEEAKEPSALNSHFSDKADLSKFKDEKSKHFVANKEKKKREKFNFSDFLTRLGNMSFLPKAIIYLVFVLIAAVYCSYFAVTGINDMFALVSLEKEANVTVTEATTIDDVTEALKEQGVIKYPWLFKLYCEVYGDGTDVKLIPGDYSIPDNLNFSNILYRLTTVKVERTAVWVTVPEGYTVDQIIDLLVSKGIGTKEKYVDAINNYPYKHEFVQLLDEMGYSEDRVYRLEGYLFPDTYEFYTDTAEYLVINRFLNNFNSRFWRFYDEEYKADVEAMGMTFDDIVTLASLVQMEAKHIIDYEPISYVFHNRLNHSNTYPFLESDATIQYFLDARKEDLTQEDLDTDNPYNTYLYAGLTPGAICCPGLDALEAAIYPARPVDANGKEINAYYFVSDVTGKTYYAQTNAGHNANKQKAEEVNKFYDEQE
ncbi:MAG: endolytic transglycosylase MltG [Ruminococcaceae bacterium]|nr:endolytic transglycosylase MltG [Oscillospiraceae bacterium]